MIWKNKSLVKHLLWDPKTNFEIKIMVNNTFQFYTKHMYIQIIFDSKIVKSVIHVHDKQSIKQNRHKS